MTVSGRAVSRLGRAVPPSIPGDAVRARMTRVRMTRARTRACHPRRLRGTAGRNDLPGPESHRPGPGVPLAAGRAGFPSPASRPPGGFPSPIPARTVRQCGQTAGDAEQAAAMAGSGPPVKPAATAVPVRAGGLDTRRWPCRAGHSADGAGSDPQPGPVGSVGGLGDRGLPAGGAARWRSGGPAGSVACAHCHGCRARALLFAALYALSAAGMLRLWVLLILALSAGPVRCSSSPPWSWWSRICSPSLA